MQNISICTWSVCHSVKYFSDIDSGWTVARINDNGENTFLKIIFKTFTNRETFYIGGNTDTGRGEFLDEGFGSDSGRVLGKVNFTAHDMKHCSQVHCTNCPFQNKLHEKYLWQYPGLLLYLLAFFFNINNNFSGVINHTIIVL